MKSAAKKSLTEAWHRAIPTLDELKPMWLVRRHGPIVFGLCLGGTSNPEAYTPTVFFHCLADPFPVLSLNAAGRLLTARKATTTLPANVTDVSQPASQMQQDYPALTKPQLDLNDAVTHLRRLRAGDYGVQVPFQHAHYQLIALSAAVIGLDAYARKTVEFAAHEMESWPPRAFNIIGSMQKWRESMLSRIQATAVLKQTVIAEAEKHGLQALGDRSLGVPAEPVGLWIK